MPVLLPPGQLFPPNTPIGSAPTGPVGQILTPGPQPTIDEPVTVPGQTTGPGGVVINTPVADPPEEIVSWTGRFPIGATITARYLEDGPPVQASKSGNVPTPALGFFIKDRSTDYAVPGSLRFTLNGLTYVDRQGELVHSVDPQNNAGTPAGLVRYGRGWVVVQEWQQGDGVVNVRSLGLVKGISPTNKLFFRTPAAPILQGSLTVNAIAYDNGELLQGTADLNGNITGANVLGFVDVQSGVAEVFFGEWVTAAGNEAEWWYNADAVDAQGDIFKPKRIVPSSATFSAVALTSIPLDPGILGLDPILLPRDGRVPVFSPGDSLMIVQRNTVEDAAPTAGADLGLGLANVKFVRVRDANNAEVLSDRYTVNEATGTLTWANPLDLAAWTGPFEVETLSYFKRLATDVQINGRISIASGAPFAMSNATAQIFLASKLIFQPDGGNQDLQALALNLFTQGAWTGEWSDEQIGSGTTGQFDDINNPIEMTNNGSITERWRLEFTGSGTVNVIGERFGQVLTGVSIASDIAPVTPATGTPYFTMRAAGFSGGWLVGNIIRFSTLGANDPVWIIRSTQPGDAPALPTDRFIALLQGDTSV